MGLRPRVRPRQGVILPRLSRHPFSVAISLTRAVAEAAGIKDEILPIYVLIHDVPPQSWGFSGKPLSFEQLQNPPAGAKPL